jgi:thiosulfate/3-mercaptopyruvate sulfurtransferase
MVCLSYRSKQFSRVLILAACFLAGTFALVCAASGPAHAAEAWEKSDLMQPEELAVVLSAPNQEKPVVVFVGFDFLFRAAHIPGALNFGPGSKLSGVESLKRWASSMKKDRAVVLYCGCCPWRQCPNVRPAFKAAREAGLKHVKVLYLQDSLVRDWVDRGYPVEKGKY